MTTRIGVVFVTYNQSQLLDSALKKLVAHNLPLYVADLSSTEDVAGICKKRGATYFKFPYTSVVETVRAEIFARIKTEYLLYLDADESIETPLLTKLISLADTGVDYVRIPRANYIFNSWVKASRWWPDYQVRFFKRGMVKFPVKLHAEPVVSGQGVTLDPSPDLAIKHLNYQTFDEWLEKNRRYAKADAADRLRASQDFTLSKAMKLSVSELVSRFYAGGGHQDGQHGLLLSILQSFYYFLVYAYYWEGKKYAPNLTSSDLKSFPRTWFTYGLSEIMFWDHADLSPIQKIKNKLTRKFLA